MADTAPKPFVFVLMPFEDAFNDVYKLGIKPACEEAGAYCERVDEQIFQKETILSRIYNQIAKADMIVADMTGRNPNVFYEVGYAHALGKQVVLLTRDSDDIPFDLKHYSHIVYSGGIAFLKEEAAKRIRWTLEHPEKRLEQVDQRLKLYLNGVELKEGCEISGNPYDLDDTLGIHNPTSRSFPSGSIKIGLITPCKYIAYTNSVEKVIDLPDKQRLFIFGGFETLFPLAWETLRVTIVAEHIENRAVKEALLFRVFTEFGAYDYPFDISSRKAL